MNFVFSYLTGLTNYNVQNINNHHNFNYLIMNKLPDDQKKEYIDTMKLTIGMRYTDDFKLYIFRKMQNSSLLIYFQ